MISDPSLVEGIIAFGGPICSNGLWAIIGEVKIMHLIHLLSMRGLADEILESRRLRDTFKYRWSTLQSELGVLKAHLKYLEEPDISLRLLSSVNQELNDCLFICDAG